MTPLHSNVADLEAIFLGHVGSRELCLPFWALSGEPVPLGLRSASIHGDRQMVWRAASGQAVLHAFCIYHRQYHPDFPPPYNVAVVELSEGHQIVSTVVAPAGELRTGMQLCATFERSGRLVFCPAANGDAQ